MLLRRGANDDRLLRATQWLEHNHIESQLKTGDIICRVGNGIWSDLCRELSKREKRFSHAGVILMGKDGTATVIHAEGNDFTGIGQVLEEPLAEFLTGGDSAAVFRLNTPNRALEDEMAFKSTIREYLGVPFDFKFDLSSHERFYCTELVYCIMGKLDPPVLLTTFRNDKGKEYVPVDQVVGIATRFYRKGRWYDVNHRGYMAYVHLWTDFFFIRRPLIWAREKERAVLGRLKRFIRGRAR